MPSRGDRQVPNHGRAPLASGSRRPPLLTPERTRQGSRRIDPACQDPCATESASFVLGARAQSAHSFRTPIRVRTCSAVDDRQDASMQTASIIFTKKGSHPLHYAVFLSTLYGTADTVLSVLPLTEGAGPGRTIVMKQAPQVAFDELVEKLREEHPGYECCADSLK
jgi:hypothetical protein